MFLIITGMSGAGKTQALKCLEDMNFFCIDNMPVDLIHKFIELRNVLGNKFDKAVLGIDIRAGKSLNSFFDVLSDIKRKNIEYRIIFLDANDSVLVRRFSETRRRHPLGKNLLLAIKEERKQLEQIRAQADKLIDTSNLTLSDLKAELTSILGITAKEKMVISLISFGYKYGLPLDADLVFDVRFLPNPNYIPRLKLKTGNDDIIRKFVLNNRVSKKFIKKVCDLLDLLLPLYVKEGKSYLTIATGCTGGQHRSVVITNFLAQFLQKKKYIVQVQYRDINK